jgi:hypothetical protein
MIVSVIMLIIISILLLSFIKVCHGMIDNCNKMLHSINGGE